MRAFGLVLLVVGVVLVIVGFNATDSLADRMSNTFTGHFTDRTTGYLIGGGAAALIGLGMLLMGGRRRSRR